MKPTDEQVQAYRIDFEAVTGHTFKTFHCPILNADRGDVELMEGHILPQAMKLASRATVIQCKDVDGYFGTTIEPDMIDQINLHKLTTSEAISKVEDLEVVKPDGTTAEAFIATPKSKPPFPQVFVRDKDGQIVSVPFVRAEFGSFPVGGQFSLKGTFRVMSAAVVGSFVKSAYLALFRLMGYEFVFTEAAKFVADALARFFIERGTKENAQTYFAPFADAVHFFQPGVFPLNFNTIETGRVVFDFDEDGLERKRLWGASTLFHVNGYTFIATLPADGFGVPFSESLEMYNRFTADWKLPQKMHTAMIKRSDGRITYGINPDPLSVGYLTKSEFLDMKAKGVKTGFE